MNEFMPWMQQDWYALGSLLTQLGFLVAGVWFARNILKTMRAFQEQAGALLKLSITATPAERQPETPIVKSSLGETSPYWLTPSLTQSVSVPEARESGPGRLVTAWHNLLDWLQEPMNSSEVAPWRRVVHWLQTPMSS